MAGSAHDKYYLKSLHEEIDLFDRKLAHLLKYETFATEAERTASAGRLNAKRELLARTARQLANEGIEFKASDLPRSFRTSDAPRAIEEPEASAPEVPVVAKRAPVREFPSPFAGTSLDATESLKEFKRGRAKAAAKAQ